MAVSFFGDGASNAGPFHECLNIAATWKLPMLYVCENNMYAAQTSAAADARLPDVAGRAAGYGIPGVVVDGNDIFAVHQAAARAVARARAGEGPTLIECKTYRWRAHTERIGQPDFRTEAEIEAWKKKDPIARLLGQLEAQGAMTDADWQAMNKEVQRDDRSRRRIRRGEPVPDAGASARRHVRGLKEDAMRELTYAQAGVEAVAEEMRTDPRIFYMSTDPIRAAAEGVRRASGSGPPRSPKAALTGIAIGAAGSGYRPIMDWRQVTFSFVAMDQIVNQAAKIHYMFGGQRTFPILYRANVGGGTRLAAQHCQCPYSMFMNLSGLKMFLPSTPARSERAA